MMRIVLVFKCVRGISAGPARQVVVGLVHVDKCELIMMVPECERTYKPETCWLCMQGERRSQKTQRGSRRRQPKKKHMIGSKG